MIKKIFVNEDHDKNYRILDNNKKLKYDKFINDIMEDNKNYIISVDLANENSKDYSAIVKFNYDKYLKGNYIVESIKYL